MLLAAGTEVAGFEIHEVLGHGGMGIVYRATQLSLGRTCALKLLSPDLSNDEDFRERFRREGRIQATLDHPHIVPVHEAGESDYGLYIAMRYVAGPNLKDLILDQQLDAARALRILAGVASALDAAHAVGLIHRDVKPQNVLCADGDHAYLADFGLIKAGGQSLTVSGQVVGTPDYMAPEQIRGEKVGPAADVYSFGAVLYECLTGSVPFPRPSEPAVIYAHLEAPPPLVSEIRPELPEALDQVIARAMAKDPETRPRSATAVADEALEALGGEHRAATLAAPVPTIRHPWPARSDREARSRRRVTRAALYLVGLAILVFATTFLIVRGNRTDRYQSDVGKLCQQVNGDLASLSRVELPRLRHALRAARSLDSERNALVAFDQYELDQVETWEPRLSQLTPSGANVEVQARTIDALKRNASLLQSYRQRLNRARTYDQLVRTVTGFSNSSLASLESNGTDVRNGLERLGGDHCDLNRRETPPQIVLSPPHSLH